jgi:DNA-binding response OmpR family regulator
MSAEQPLVLIIDDDPEMTELLTQILQADGFDTLVAHDGVEGLAACLTSEPDLVLLDVLMPKMGGLETCRLLREFSDVPIIMLSCRQEEMDRVRGLELGADDYVAKPLPKAELVARIRAVLRRQHGFMPDGGLVQIDDRLSIDRNQGTLQVDGRTEQLTATELRLLCCLLDNAGRICTRQSLLAQVWGWEYVDETNYLKTYIYNLRRKLEQDPRDPQYILTERGLGYRLYLPCDFYQN